MIKKSSRNWFSFIYSNESSILPTFLAAGIKVLTVIPISLGVCFYVSAQRDEQFFNSFPEYESSTGQ